MGQSAPKAARPVVVTVQKDGTAAPPPERELWYAADGPPRPSRGGWSRVVDGSTETG